jgi:hypothetical protein
MFVLAQAKAVSLTLVLLSVVLAVSLLSLGLKFAEKPVTETILLTTTERVTETSSVIATVLKEFTTTSVLTSTKLVVETVTQKELTTIVAPPTTLTLTVTETITQIPVVPISTITVTVTAPPTTITRTVTTTITSTTTQYITHTSTTTTITTTITPVNLTTTFVYKADAFELKLAVPTYLNLATPDSKKPSTVDIYLKKDYPLSGFFNIELEFGVKVKLPTPTLYIFSDVDMVISNSKITDVYQLEWPIYGIPTQAISLESGDVGVYALAIPVKEAKGNLEDLPVGEWIHVGSYNLYVVEESNLMALGIPAENVVIGGVISLETP